MKVEIALSNEEGLVASDSSSASRGVYEYLRREMFLQAMLRPKQRARAEWVTTPLHSKEEPSEAKEGKDTDRQRV